MDLKRNKLQAIITIKQIQKIIVSQKKKVWKNKVKNKIIILVFKIYNNMIVIQE